MVIEAMDMDGIAQMTERRVRREYDSVWGTPTLADWIEKQ